MLFLIWASQYVVIIPI
uniref:Uncharacterized protein n=1 Tax=Arundo donax TaxID=35708 RepID=A0A0A9F059_ARUDO